MTILMENQCIRTRTGGITVHALVSAAPVTPGGVLSGAVAVWQDVTEQEQV